MPFDLTNLNPAVKFDFDPEGQEWLEVRVATDKDSRKFFESLGIKETVEHRVNPQTRALERITFFKTTDAQREQFEGLVWDFSIVDWRLLCRTGKRDVDGQDGLEEIPCTKENKILMMQSPVFVAFYQGCLEKLRKQLEVFKGEEEKNS